MLTDSCDHFLPELQNGQCYFMKFTNYYSRYGYIYLTHEKSYSLETFKTYKPVVKNRINKMIKSVQSDLGGEFYGRNDNVLDLFLSISRNQELSCNILFQPLQI